MKRLNRVNTKTRRIITGLLTLLMMAILNISASADVMSGLQAAENQLLSDFKTIITTIVVPIAAVLVVAILVFNIVRLSMHKRQGGDITDNVIGIAICITVLILLGTFEIWGITMWTTGSSGGASGGVST